MPISEMFGLPIMSTIWFLSIHLWNKNPLGKIWSTRQNLFSEMKNLTSCVVSKKVYRNEKFDKPSRQ